MEYNAANWKSVYDEEQFYTLMLNVDDKINNSQCNIEIEDIKDEMGKISPILEKLDTKEGI